MTALPLNLHIAHPTKAPGIPLDGLPPLEPGGNLSQAFADALGKAGKSAGAGEGDAEAALVADPKAALGDLVGEGEPTDPGLTVTEPEGNAETGKTLPSARPEIAGRQVAQDAAASVDEGAAEPKPETDGDAAPVGLAAQKAQVEQSLVAPILVPAGTATVSAATAQAGSTSDAASKPGIAARGAASAPTASAQAAIATLTQGDSEASTGQQGMTGGDTGKRGEAQAEQAARLATRQLGDAAAPAAKAQDTAQQQTGLSLQVRAAEKPFAALEASQLGNTGPLQSTTGLSAIAAPVPGAPTATVPTFGTAQPGQMPGFPELSALVDRIAAARDSVGSASATVAVAHKELGNLSLTFETSGRNLDVQVAAQDSETQRSLAAAIAADRPNFRGGEGQSQNAPGQNATGAQTGDANTRQSGSADKSGSGDDRSQRPDSSSGAPATHEQPQARPNSDGGIYA